MRCNYTRREFLAASAAMAVSTAARSAPAAFGDSKASELCIFTKPFNSLSFDDLASHVADLGFDGVEAPVRRGGNVEPDQVEDRLPELVEALSKHDLKVTVITTDIGRADNPLTERVLRTAAELGIKRYRMAYYQYNPRVAISSQLDQWRVEFGDLAALNRELGIQGVYQNHAGAQYFGSALWDLDQVLGDIAVDEIGLAYDIRHATVEGGTNWPTTFRMIRPHIAVVYVKDFAWNGRQVRNVPLGEGRVDPKFFQLLSDSGFRGPISLHEEYLDHRQPELVPDHLAAIRHDLDVLKRWLG